MKKILFMITSLLAISAACLAGCTGNNNGNEQEPEEKNYEIVRSSGEDEDEKCRDGNCENEDEKAVPDFMYRPHHGEERFDEDFSYRHPRHHRSHAETTDDSVGDETEPDEKPDKPHCRKGKGKRNPLPKPMPTKPKSN